MADATTIEGPPAKRRKLEDGSAEGGEGSGAPPASDTPTDAGEQPKQASPATPDNNSEAGDEADKKEEPAETTSKNTEEEDLENEDILVSGWLYIDSFGKRQGPFSTIEMQEWRHAGYLMGDVKVKRVTEDEFYNLSSVPLLSKVPPPRKPVYVPTPQYTAQTSTPSLQYGTPYEQPAQRPAADSATYMQSAAFTTMGGRFKAQTPEERWASMGIASDRDGRMMGHYFNVDQYQEEMRQKADAPQKPHKLTKKQLAYYRNRKAQKRASNFLK